MVSPRILLKVTESKRFVAVKESYCEAFVAFKDDNLFRRYLVRLDKKRKKFCDVKMNEIAFLSDV